MFKDNKAFLCKLHSYLKKQKLPESKTDFKFIAVAEPQGENHGNAWHIHLLLINNIYLVIWRMNLIFIILM